MLKQALTQTLPAALLLAGAAAAQSQDYHIVTDEHIDLRLINRGGVWGTMVHGTSGDYIHTDTLLYDGPQGSTVFDRPEGAEWDFLGTGAGMPIYIFPQTQYDEQIFLGFGSDDGSITPGTFASYLETDPRVNNTAAWNKITLVGMRFIPDPTDTSTQPAHFSLWDNTSTGGSTVWMSTADGFAPTDATWMVSGGHSHYNWGFTRRGYYQLDFRFSGFLNNPDRTFSESDTYTFHFGVEYLPPVLVPEPGATLLFTLGSGVAALGRWRRRVSPFA